MHPSYLNIMFVRFNDTDYLFIHLFCYSISLYISITIHSSNDRLQVVSNFFYYQQCCYEHSYTFIFVYKIKCFLKAGI